MQLTESEGIYLLALMTAMGDGEISEAESNVIADRLARHGNPVPPGRSAELVYVARESYAEPANAVTHVAAAIPPAARLGALRLALEVAAADAAMAPTEMATIREFCDALDIDKRELDRLMRQSA